MYVVANTQHGMDVTSKPRFTFQHNVNRQSYFVFARFGHCASLRDVASVFVYAKRCLMKSEQIASGGGKRTRYSGNVM